MYFLHHGIMWAFYFIPLALILIHRCLKKGSALHLSAFALLFTVVWGSLDSMSLLIFPAVVPLYAFLVARRYYSLPLIDLLKKAVVLLFLSLLAGAIYLAPLWWKCNRVD